MSKGVLDIEFVLTVVVFLSAITFVSFTIISNIPVFHREAVNEELRSHAYQISQLLLMDEGEPASWNTNPQTVKRLGLSSGDSYRLSSAKITAMASICGSYSNLKANLSVDFTRDVKVSIVDASGNALLNCGPAINTTIIPEFPVTRFGVLDSTNDIVRMYVSVI